MAKRLIPASANRAVSDAPRLCRSRCGSFLRCRGRPGELVRITQLQPSHVDDFLRVATEMRKAVKARCQPGDIEPLGAPDLQQLSCGQSAQQFLRLTHHGVESAYQPILRDRAQLRKLDTAVP